jgi:hypothetical protein
VIAKESGQRQAQGERNDRSGSQDRERQGGQSAQIIPRSPPFMESPQPQCVITAARLVELAALGPGDSAMRIRRQPEQY